MTLTRFDVRPVAEDGPTAPVLTIRNYQEGVATSHFTPSRARLTGIPPLPGAPYVLITGDSFVAAEQLADRQTIGAQLEEISARHGERLNAWQYGWIAAAPAKYVLEAPEMVQKWHPALTVVVLNFDDFVPEALHDGWTTMTLSSGAPPVIARVDPYAQNRSHARMALLLSKSGLLRAVVPRFVTEIWPGLRRAFDFRSRATHTASAPQSSTQPSLQAIVNASVSELHRAFGDRLLLIYAAEPGLDNETDNTESALLRSCEEQRVDCYSTRADFIRARDRGEFLAAGFSNSQPAHGHYNADGDRLIAQEIWREYKKLFPEKE